MLLNTFGDDKVGTEAGEHYATRKTKLEKCFVAQLNYAAKTVRTQPSSSSTVNNSSVKEYIITSPESAKNNKKQNSN